MLVSPSVSLVVAGIASGICFLIYSNILKGWSEDSNDDKRKNRSEENHCICCLRPFYLERGVRCKDCGAKSCRKGCSRWDASDNAWHCLFCRQQRYWLKKNEHEIRGVIEKEDLYRYFNTAKSQVYVAGVENAATSSGQSLATEREEANTMETIRDFVEKIVEALIGNLSDTPINRLYDHPAYKPSTDSPTMAHTALREIVERAVDEARKLPGLGTSGGTGRPQEGRNIAEDSYEDVLATAILNKVIEKFQTEQVDGNRNVQVYGGPMSVTRCAPGESEAGLDEGVEEGCSSLEPLSQDDCSSDCSASYSRRVRNQPEPLSLTIEEQIEEVTTTYASDEDHRENDVLAVKNTHRVPFPELGMDIIDPSQESEDSQDEADSPTAHIGLVSPIESWEENWLFQKKRVQSQADPVAMLVPNPSADFKALIGDKDAEDTSDLSDCSCAQSDDEIEKELMEAINNVVPRTPEGTEFDNGPDRYPPGISQDPSIKRNREKAASVNVDERNEVNKNESNENERKRAKNIEGKKSKRIEAEIEKPVSQSIQVISRDLDKADTNGRATNDEPKQNETEHFIRDNNLKILYTGSMECSESVEKNFSNSGFVQPSTVSTSEESVAGLPRTPTCTPTRTPMTEIRLQNENNVETFVSREENVLNSLECAKKKLMAVNDDTVEAFKEDASSVQQRTDFHAEDIQQESEYTEHYDTAIQRHLDSLTKTEPCESLTEDNERRCREAAAFAKAESASHVSLQNKKSEEEVRLAAPPRPGTIAEREHKKWENAPPIENNPYSQENIQKRLLERQYSRRSSDIPGIHTELPKSNGEDLDAILAPHEPDIKRFGRDYYINESRSSSNEKGRRSAASTASRPSSSLSQRSSSTGMADQDQQVSFRLKKFEEASLRGSLSRWTYRDPYSSPHFAINPLLHMEVNETTVTTGGVHEKIQLSDENSMYTENNNNNNINNNHNYNNEESINCISETKLNEIETSRNKNVYEHNLESQRIDDDISSKIDDVLSNKSSSKLSYNPLYEPEHETTKTDRDSGMYSADTNDLEANEKQEQDNWRRLWINDWHSDVKNDQMLSSNGKKYWNFNGYKYHTFGGIKNPMAGYVDESEEDIPKEETPDESFDISDFANFKFQTFGGIKKTTKADGKGIPMYRKATLKPSSRNYKNGRTIRSSQSDVALRNENEEYVDLRTCKSIDYQSESSDGNGTPVSREGSKVFRMNSKGKYDNERPKRQPKTFYPSSCQSSSDDDWQDEVGHAPKKMIMRKFLMESTRKVKSRSSSDNDSTYFVNTSRRKSFHGLRKNISQKQRSLGDNESLKLEPPIVPEVVEKTFETLQDLRVKGRKKKHESSGTGKKFGVRCLSDLTIW